MGSKRSYYWAFIGYPESLPENFESILSDFHIKILQSPLHDKDLKEDGSGDYKKPHYHFMILFDSLKTYEQAKTVSDAVNGAMLPAPLESKNGYIRYLIHFDNPEKTQYEREEIRSYSGAVVDIEPAFENEVSDDILLGQIFTFCSFNNISEYCDLVNYCIKYRRDWYRVIVHKNTYAVCAYVKSIKHRRYIDGQAVDANGIIVDIDHYQMPPEV